MHVDGEAESRPNARPLLLRLGFVLQVAVVAQGRAQERSRLDRVTVNKVAEVVRDLWRREQDRGLSAGEKRMLAKARQILVGELALAEGTDQVKADTILDEVLAAAS